MNCLFTVNINDFVTDYSRRSFLSACCRWKCDYSELTTNSLDGYPSTAKWFGAKKLQGFSCLMFVDGDCVISPKTPNPFDLCTEDNVLYAVTDLQAGNPNDLWRKAAYIDPSNEVIKDRPAWKLHPESRAFNAGVFLFRQTALMRSVFQNAIDIFPKHWTSYQEQCCLNLSVHNTPGVRLELIPLKWNYMVIFENENIDGNFINHYGGSAHAILKRKV